MQKRELRVNCDEDFDGGFAFFNENETGNYIF